MEKCDYHFKVCECLETFTTTTTINPCPNKIPNWWGDKYCDDEMNTEGCEYDGGDCCQDNPTPNWNAFCSICDCLEDHESP